MPRFEPWQIVAVPFPYIERPVQKRRPALIVATGLGGSHDLLWVLMITAAVDPGWPEDVRIEDHVAAGLPIPSMVRTAKIATIPSGIARKIGILPRADTVQVAAILRGRLPTARPRR